MKTMTPDHAAVLTIVESVGALADRGEFDALGRLFADEFTLDYSSLNGRPPEARQPLDLMAEWAGVLPGFDRTRHALSNLVVDVSGNAATARADVVASHWLDDRFWQVSGHYDYDLAKSAGEWAITSMTFTLEDEDGTRDVFGPAMAAAERSRGPGQSALIGERNKATVRKFFKTLENEDIPALVGLFSEDGVQVNPYHGGIFPAGAEGEEGLLAYWTPVPGNFDGMRFPIDELLATEDPDVVFVRYRGEIKLKDGAGYYKNDYYSTFRFNDAGEITEYVEIFDPVVAARGFGLLDQLK
ncbi:MAG: nuclear transport factor 2 family protein [Acidobacteriota bacterium]